MECRSLQNNETEIMENYIHLDEDDTEESYLSHEELGEYKKIQEMFLTFSKTKPKNTSHLRKSLFNIAASLMRLLAILEDIPNQKSSDCRVKNSKTNHKCDEYDKSSTEDQSILKKINRHLGQKNDRKYEQTPKVTIKKVCNNNKPAYIGYTDRSLYENDECRTNTKKSDSRSSQCIQFLPENDTQTILQTHEICNTQLNNETEIVFECKNVKPAVSLCVSRKLQNKLQDSEISVPTRAAIKNERLDMVKKEYLDNNIEKVNLNNDCETNGQNGIITPLNSIHVGEESEMFETCSKKLENNSNLKVHKDTVHDHITHSCGICGKKFTQKHKLKIHTDVVHNRRKPYQCDTCGKTFARKDKLVHHMDSIHISIPYTCSTCGKTFTQKDYLKNHIDFVHKNLKHHKCDRCQKAFSVKGSLNLHMRTVHNGITYTCDFCEKIFTQKGHLRLHIDTVHMSNKKLYNCDECQKSFNYKSHLTSHIDNVHEGITHSCDLCEKVFRHKSDLKLHKDSVHNDMTHKCDECGKTFTLKYRLDRHVDSIHFGITHSCDSCGKTYNRKDKLKDHIDTVHKGITHPCNLCEKVFRQKLGLKLHKDYVHKGITYSCNLCRKVFSNKGHLKVHKDSVHKGICHPCNQCEKLYTQKTYLKLHIDKIHNGKK